ncbi:MAG: flagellar export chaperone FlgN [Candidatus Delongbacteria bacterium]
MNGALHELAERLAARLDEELGLYHELEQELNQQLEALQSGQPERVLELSESVERCHHLLRGQERRRRLLLEALQREFPSARAPLTLRQVAECCPPALSSRLHLLGRRLRTHLHRVHELKSLTGRVVEKERRFNRRRLEWLLDATRESATYGPDARPRTDGAASRLIDRRV